jgi:hypothetical protein
VFWHFFGFNDGPADRHEGDWEKTLVRLDRYDHPTEVGYVQHACPAHIVSWASVPRDGLTHPIVYTALGNHAGYWSTTLPASMYKKPCGRTLSGGRDKVGVGAEWRPWQTAKLKSATTALWYGYGGGWGAPATAHFPHAGPIAYMNWGPAGPSPALLRFDSPVPRAW